MTTAEKTVVWCVVEHKANRDVPRVVFDSCEAARELAKEWNEAMEIGLLDPYYGVEEVLLGDGNWLERTCNNLASEGRYEGVQCKFACSACGHKEAFSLPSHCPICNAKVVEA